MRTSQPWSRSSLRPLTRHHVAALWLVAAVALAAPGSLRAQAPAPPPAPPVAARHPHATTLHGAERSDDYYWLREKQSPEVLGYLRAETTYAEAVMKPFAPLRERLYRELVGRLQEDDSTAPVLNHGYYYYRRNEKGKQYQILCRKRGALSAAEEVLLDLNGLAAGKKFIALGDWQPSIDGRWLAYTTDVTGFRDYTLYLQDLGGGPAPADGVAHVSDVAWAADSHTLFYTVEDKAKRAYRVYRHALGAPFAKDALVYEERDERFRVGVDRTRSDAYVLIASESHTQSEWRALPAARPTAAPMVIAAREKDHQYSVDHRGDRFYIRSNRAGRTFGIYSAPVRDPRPANWKQVVETRPAVMIDNQALFSRWLVLHERENALPYLRVIDLQSGASHRVAVDEQVYNIRLDGNFVFATNTLRFVYTSFTTPLSDYDYDMATRQRTLVKRQPVPNYDPTRYLSERIAARAGDGVMVPISLVYKKGLVKDGRAPLLLGGYGSYGISSDAQFNQRQVSLLDRGVVLAVAHIRGGGDLGKPWHDDGRMLHKRNTFTDFIAVAEHLIAQRYTSSARLVIRGGSAGGLLMGAVTNMRPDLFRAVMAYVPFVDVINTMLDESLPLTVGEFEEWGNPTIKEQYDYMRSYSPYDNVSHQAYPAMLVVSALNDSQVMYWEPAKWVARLRANKTDRNPLLFRINLDPAGHGGAGGRYDQLRDTAWEFAFCLWQMGISE